MSAAVRQRLAWLAGVAVFAVAAGALGGCSPKIARLVNPTGKKCQASLRHAFEMILLDQDEKPEVAQAVADSASQSLADVDLGPRPFKVSSPSGADYAFFFDPEDNRCLLRLFGRFQGLVQVTNNVTYIATRPLPGCRCEK